MSAQISAEMIEDLFGKQSDSRRFANFCNAVVLTVSPPSSAIPVLSEKPGADGGIDGEWRIPADITNDFQSPFGVPGWNVFQYTARSVASGGRQQASSDLCSSVKGALVKLAGRLTEQEECNQYSLFTNLQLGLETRTRTADQALLQNQRSKMQSLIKEGSNSKTSVMIFDAAQLAAFVNANPALRLTYFSPNIACSWSDAWEREERAKNYKSSVPFIGRNQELNAVSELLKDKTTKVIVLCGPSGMGKTRLALMIMEFINQADRWAVRAASILSLYLHLGKPLPRELIPFGRRVLEEAEISKILLGMEFSTSTLAGLESGSKSHRERVGP
jgi:hypothetical protein